MTDEKMKRFANLWPRECGKYADGFNTGWWVDVSDTADVVDIQPPGEYVLGASLAQEDHLSAVLRRDLLKEEGCGLQMRCHDGVVSIEYYKPWSEENDPYACALREADELTAVMTVWCEVMEQ